MAAAHTICFVRHGETDWNRAGRMQGTQDIPLNALGREQAHAAGTLLAGIHPEIAGFHFVASPLLRTRDTMGLVRNALGLDAGTYALEERLRERSWGVWEGATWDDVRRTDPQARDEHDRDRWNYVPADGESYAMVGERLRAWIAGIDQPTVAVSHGGVARVLIHMLAGVSTVDLPLLEITQGRVLVFEGGGHRWV
jgi:broad specificity phosphatase PhoE